MLVRNNSFKDYRKDWEALFTENNIFIRLQKFETSVERSKFNFIVLQKALEKDIVFIVEDLLDGRVPITNQMIKLLLKEGQKKLLVSLLSDKNPRATRPKYLCLESKKFSQNIKKLIGSTSSHIFSDKSQIDLFQGEREICFMDMVMCALEMGEKNDSIIELLQFMRNEVTAKNLPDGPI